MAVQRRLAPQERDLAGAELPEGRQQPERVVEGDLLVDEVRDARLVDALLAFQVAPVRHVHEDLVQALEVMGELGVRRERRRH